MRTPYILALILAAPVFMAQADEAAGVVNEKLDDGERPEFGLAKDVRQQVDNVQNDLKANQNAAATLPMGVMFAQGSMDGAEGARAQQYGRLAHMMGAESGFSYSGNLEGGMRDLITGNYVASGSNSINGDSAAALNFLTTDAGQDFLREMDGETQAQLIDNMSNIANKLDNGDYWLPPRSPMQHIRGIEDSPESGEYRIGPTNPVDDRIGALHSQIVEDLGDDATIQERFASYNTLRQVTDELDNTISRIGQGNINSAGIESDVTPIQAASLAYHHGDAIIDTFPDSERISRSVSTLSGRYEYAQRLNAVPVSDQVNSDGTLPRDGFSVGEEDYRYKGSIDGGPDLYEQFNGEGEATGLYTHTQGHNNMRRYSGDVGSGLLDSNAAVPVEDNLQENGALPTQFNMRGIEYGRVGGDRDQALYAAYDPVNDKNAGFYTHKPGEQVLNAASPADVIAVNNPGIPTLEEDIARDDFVMRNTRQPTDYDSEGQNAVVAHQDVRGRTFTPAENTANASPQAGDEQLNGAGGANTTDTGESQTDQGRGETSGREVTQESTRSEAPAGDQANEPADNADGTGASTGTRSTTGQGTDGVQATNDDAGNEVSGNADVVNDDQPENPPETDDNLDDQGVGYSVAKGEKRTPSETRGENDD